MSDPDEPRKEMSDSAPEVFETLEHPSDPVNPEEVKARIAEHEQATRKIPTEFGRYRIEKTLGSGGMGAVYLAHDTNLDRQVALKVPSFGGGDDETVVERFYREARAAATLDHPNLCPVHDVGVIDGIHYLTMAYIKGRPLTAAIRPEGLPPRQVAALIRKIALALHEAHRKGVIHRDLKPANIMINVRRQPVVMDFGLAQRTKSGDARLTQKGSFVGTPAYMSPEQITNSGKIGPASDLFSLGIITYELLVGERPFQGDDSFEVVGAVLTEEPVSPADRRSELDPEISSICLRAIAKKPSARYASMREYADALGNYLIHGAESAVELGEDRAHEEPEQGEDTLVQEMLKGINDSQTSGVSRSRVTPSRRRSKLPWVIVGCVAVSIIPLAFLIAGAISGDPQETAEIESDGVMDAPPKTSERMRTSPANRSLLAGPSGTGKDMMAKLEAASREPTVVKNNGNSEREPATTSTPGANSTDRLIAAWVFDNGGSILIRDHRGSVTPVESIDQIPETPFHLLELNLSRFPASSDQELSQLNELTQLRRVTIAESLSPGAHSRLTQLRKSIPGCDFRFPKLEVPPEPATAETTVASTEDAQPTEPASSGALSRPITFFTEQDDDPGANIVVDGSYEDWDLSDAYLDAKNDAVGADQSREILRFAPQFTHDSLYVAVETAQPPPTEGSVALELDIDLDGRHDIQVAFNGKENKIMVWCDDQWHTTQEVALAFGDGLEMRVPWEFLRSIDDQGRIPKAAPPMTVLCKLLVNGGQGVGTVDMTEPLPARHRLNESQLRTAMAAQAQQHGPVRWESIWVRDPNGWELQSNLNADGLTKAMRSRRRASLVCLRGYTGDDGNLRYAALWTKGRPTEAMFSLTREDVEKRLTEKQRKGMRPVFADAYVYAQQPRFNLIWVRDASPIASAWMFSRPDKLAQEAKVAASNQTKMAIRCLAGWCLGNKPECLLLFAQAREIPKTLSWRELDYRNHTENGLLTFVDSYRHMNGTRFLTVWAAPREDIDTRVESSVGREAFDELCQQMKKQRYRPVSFTVAR